MIQERLLPVANPPHHLQDGPGESTGIPSETFSSQNGITQDRAEGFE